MGLQAQLDLLGHRVFLVVKARRVILVHRGQLALKATRVLELQGPLVSRAQRVLQALKVFRARPAHKGRKVPRVLQEAKARLAHRALRDLRGKPVSPAPLVL